MVRLLKRLLREIGVLSFLRFFLAFLSVFLAFLVVLDRFGAFLDDFKRY